MIRWIRPRLGTAPFDAIEDRDVTIVDVRHLVDKAGNPASSIMDILETASAAYNAGKKVVLACDHGISRSNAIAAGVLSIVESHTYDAALSDVARVTGETAIKLDVSTAVRNALGADTSQDDALERGPILITGASGFLGRSVVEMLKGRSRVLAPQRSELDVATDVTALEALCRRERVGQILHLAYPAIYTDSTAAALSITMLRNIIDVCRVRQARLIFVSSWVVFSGYASAAMIVSENIAPLPKGIYGESKYLEEQLVQIHARRGEIEVTTCRLGPVYGPGGRQPRFIRTFYEAAKLGKTIFTHRFKNGPPALDLLYVDDAAKALRAALESRHDGIFHFGAGELRTTANLAATIAEAAGAKADLAELQIDDVTGNIALDSAKAARFLQWRAQVPVEEGLRRTLDLQPAY